MTNRRLGEFRIVTIDDLSMTNRSSIITVLNTGNAMTDQIFSKCRAETTARHKIRNSDFVRSVKVLTGKIIIYMLTQVGS